MPSIQRKDSQNTIQSLPKTNQRNTHSGGSARKAEAKAKMKVKPSNNSHNQNEQRHIIAGVDIYAMESPPTSLSCGYCCKMVYLARFTEHEIRCSKGKESLYATPCFACSTQGPHCRCWATRNNVLSSREVAAVQQEKETRKKTLFKGLFRSSGEWDKPPAPKVTASTSLPPITQQEKEKMEWLFGYKADEERRQRSTNNENDQQDNYNSDINADTEGYIKQRRHSSSDYMYNNSNNNFSTYMSAKERRLEREKFEKMTANMASIKFRALHDQALMQQHVSRWETFEQYTPAEISYDSIPWIPKLTPLHTRDGTSGEPGERYDIIGITESASLDVKKIALRQAMIRWHPDKFISKFGTGFLPDDRKRISEELDSTSHRLNALKSRLAQEVEDRNNAMIQHTSTTEKSITATVD